MLALENNRLDIAEDLFREIDPDQNYFNTFFGSLEQPRQSNYFSVSQYNQSFSINTSDTLTIVNANVRSFNANGEAMATVLKSLTSVPDVIILTETWLSELSKPYAELEGYNSYHQVREERRSGGVSIFCRQDLNVETLDHLSVCNQTIETMTINIVFPGDKIALVAVYRPHSGTIENFSHQLHGILHNNSIANQKTVIAGDLNINLLNQQSETIQTFINDLQSLHFIPVITKPTHFPPSNIRGNPTLLDHIWINCLNTYRSGILTIDVTDHTPAFIQLFIPTNKTETIKIQFRVHSLDNKNRFMQELSTVDWDALFVADINTSTQSFVTHINSLYRRHFPLKTKFISVKRLEKPWLTNGLLQSIKTKSRYFKLHKLGLISNETNTRYKNMLTSVLRKAKNNYFKNLFVSNKNDVKKTWNLINKLLSNKNNKRKCIKSLIVNENETNDCDVMANEFNTFFSTVARNLDQQIPVSHDSPLDGLTNSPPNSFFMSPVTVQECTDIISKLKNTTYHRDVLPVAILKYAKDKLAVPIAKLINKSYEEGVFPDCLKIACVSPIFKAGDPKSASNYRPISVLPLLSKILERSIANRMISFMNRILCISPKQFGFQKGKSTLDAIICLTEYIYNNLNKKHHTLSIFVDLRKAFDTVNHKILLSKLQHYGFRGLSLQWFGSYLKDRLQQVRINDNLSPLSTVNIGVPQGSILGPILFLIYINDLPNVSKLFHFILFADDTTLSITHKNYNSLIQQTNSELLEIDKWIIKNRLSLNVDKTFLMLFTNRSQDVDDSLDVTFSDDIVKIQNSGNFLGMILDNNLSFGEHISYICNKISKSIGVFHKLKLSVPENVLVNLYYSLVYPYLIYCNAIWGGTHDVHIEKLFLLQKKIIRVVTNKPYLAHTTPLFHKTKILKIRDLHTYLTAIHAFKLKQTSGFTYPSHSYGTRHRHDPVPQFQRLSQTQRSLSYVAPVVWNSLPQNIKQLERIGTFKTELKKHLINNYAN